MTPYAAAKVESIAKLYGHYAARLELHEKEALISAIPSLAALPEHCGKSPSAKKTGWGVCAGRGRKVRSHRDDASRSTGIPSRASGW